MKLSMSSSLATACLWRSEADDTTSLGHSL
jgi:hypothetical protein